LPTDEVGTMKVAVNPPVELVLIVDRIFVEVGVT
jgi:hypothetical protein